MTTLPLPTDGAPPYDTRQLALDPAATFASAKAAPASSTTELGS